MFSNPESRMSHTDPLAVTTLQVTRPLAIGCCQPFQVSFRIQGARHSCEPYRITILAVTTEIESAPIPVTGEDSTLSYVTVNSAGLSRLSDPNRVFTPPDHQAVFPACHRCLINPAVGNDSRCLGCNLGSMAYALGYPLRRLELRPCGTWRPLEVLFA